MDFRERLGRKRAVLLDGALGSELTHRGIATPLPLWSAAALDTAPESIAAIHADHARAGAEVITAATFRTTRRTLAKAQGGAHGGASGSAAARPLADEARRLVRQAVELARAAGAPFVAGSIAPLEDCYEPGRVADDATLAREHAWLVRDLADAEVDLLLIETMNTVREAVAAARAARATGLATVASVVCGSDGRLLGGERVAVAAEALIEAGVTALGINCTPVATLERPLAELLAAAAGRVPCAAYGNVGHTDAIAGWTTTADCPPTEYARTARQWLAQGARIVGGCCGTTAEHVAALRQLLEGDAPAV